MREEERERKAAEKQQLADQKAQQKQIRKTQSDAQKMSVKLNTVLGPLAELLRSSDCAHVPKFATTKANAALHDLQLADLECQARISDSNPPDLAFGPEEVSTWIKAGNEAKAMMTSMLSAIRKHAFTP